MTAALPPRMLALPRDPRGLPIPYAQFVGADGVPDFRVLDDFKVTRCLRQRRCGLCGERLGPHLFFIGGPLCVENGYFYDPPMHRDCATYALQACAHLNRAKGRYNLAPYPKAPGFAIVEGDIDPSHKAEWFALMRTTSCKFSRDERAMLVIKAKLPWLEVEPWLDGERI